MSTTPITVSNNAAPVAPRRIGEYDLYETIGTGSYSTVKRAIREDTGAVVAVKVVEKQRINRDWNRQQLRRELELTRSFSHPNVCGLLDAMQTSRNVYLVFPHAPNGDLFGAIVNAGRLSESTTRRWFRQLASGVAHVHSKGVVHRDIKPENILIDASNNILLSDFGFCAAQAPGEKVYALCGSPHTIAPEVLSSDDGYCGVAADVWSLGIVLYVMLAGRYPYAASNMEELLPEILLDKWTFPRSFPAGAAALVKRMLVVDPTARASMADICADPWVRGVAASAGPGAVNMALAHGESANVSFASTRSAAAPNASTSSGAHAHASVIHTAHGGAFSSNANDSLGAVSPAAAAAVAAVAAAVPTTPPPAGAARPPKAPQGGSVLATPPQHAAAPPLNATPSTPTPTHAMPASADAAAAAARGAILAAMPPLAGGVYASTAAAQSGAASPSPSPPPLDGSVFSPVAPHLALTAHHNCAIGSALGKGSVVGPPCSLSPLPQRASGGGPMCLATMASTPSAPGKGVSGVAGVASPSPCGSASEVMGGHGLIPAHAMNADEY